MIGCEKSIFNTAEAGTDTDDSFEPNVAIEPMMPKKRKKQTIKAIEEPMNDANNVLKNDFIGFKLFLTKL